MFIIQNTACVPVVVNSNDRRVSIFKETLKDRRINKIMLFSSDEDSTALSPTIPDQMVSQVNELDTLSLFLTLVDKDKKVFINELDLRTQIIDTYRNNRFVELLINRTLDLDQSFINFKGDANVNGAYIPLIFFYQKNSLKPFSDMINGSVTVRYNPSKAWEDILLSSALTNTLKGKLIKKIYVSGDNSLGGNPCGYLDLICCDGKHIENLPLDFLRSPAPKDIWFDQLDIDFEHSYFRQRSMFAPAKPLDITFIY